MVAPTESLRKGRIATMKELARQRITGVVICAIAATIATAMASLSIGGVSLSLIGAPVISIVAGMLIATCAPSVTRNARLAPGVQFTGKKVLQYAVVAMGFTLNLTAMANVGATTLPIIIVTISAALLTAFAMMKALHLDAKLSCLIGVGSCICGGSAIAATAPVIKAKDAPIAQALTVVFLFNVVAALTFPALGQFLGLGSEGFAIFAGTAVNDTSSVTATAATAESIYGTSGILAAAVTVKLTRTLAIVPICLALSYWESKHESAPREEGRLETIRRAFPTFILFFIAASALSTIVGLLPTSPASSAYESMFVPAVTWAAKFLIAMAMFAIGLKTNLRDLVAGGTRPIAMGLACWVAIIIASLVMQGLTGTYTLNI